MPTATLSAGATADAAADRLIYARERAEIDESCRWPVLAWFGTSVFWLLLASAGAILASIKLHDPEFLARFPGLPTWLRAWLEPALTFGRLRAVHLNGVAYGWMTPVSIGIVLWMTARLCRTPIPSPAVLLVSVVLWNLGVVAGTIGLLAGGSEGVEWLEFPRFVPPILFAAFGMVTIWVFWMFARRRERHIYVTQWYASSAVVWLPWIYSVACLLIVYRPVTGSVQGAVNWWFAHNFLGLWLTPVGVGAAYYIIPKVIGRPIHSYYLSILGFWSLALFYAWAGTHHLIGGPLPAWLITAGIVGSFMMFLPVAAVALNHHLTMVGYFNLLRYSPTLRFVVFGAMAYTITSVQGSLEALRSVNEVTHFTHYTVGHAHLGVYGFFTMVSFGCMYYIVPRLTGWEWWSARLISAHFWLCSLGISLYFIALSVGGWLQGVAMIDVNAKYVPPFIEIVRMTIPYLQARSVAGTMMTLGHICFAALFVLNLLHVGRRREGPTMFAEKPVAEGAETGVVSVETA